MNRQHVDQAALDACAREPIRIPGGIQPHGALIVVDPGSLKVLQASANTQDFLGVSLSAGTKLDAGPTAALAAEFKRWVDNGDGIFMRTAEVGGRSFQVSAHRGAQGAIIEFEAPPQSHDLTLEAVYPRLQRIVENIAQAEDVAGIAELAVREVRSLTQFNRVMLYCFDEDGVGTVIAEDGDGVLPSHLNLRFPGSDIPPQARELYRLNRLRLIAASSYQPVPIVPANSPIDNNPLDLSHAGLRTVSPVHLEYMRNMDTNASMSISILVDGALWGLISAHHQTPREVNPQIRSACDFLGQIVSLQIGSRQRADAAAYRMQLKKIEAKLLAALSSSHKFYEELQKNGSDWLRMVGADGAALITPESFITYGHTPSHPELNALAAWLHHRGTTDIFHTDSLAQHWSMAADFADVASGVIAISISQIHPSYIFWFRQEVVRTVNWAGDPRKPAGTAGRLTPRQSFETWKEQVRQRSLAWTDVEIESARDFRHAIIDFVLRRAEERAELTGQLQRINDELEAFSYSVSHDLRAPFRHIAGYSALLAERETNLDQTSKHYLDQILDTTVSAGQLVDNLLSFSHLGRVQLERMRVDMNKLLIEAKRVCEQDQERTVDWQIGALLPAYGDAGLLRQVWVNLIDNALKYTSTVEAPRITITCEELDDSVRYAVSDNGVGFDMTYVGKLFGVFQRLHRSEEFPGTGIGLALVKRIIDRHGGKVTAEGSLGKGAAFTFTLPKHKKDP